MRATNAHGLARACMHDTYTATASHMQVTQCLLFRPQTFPSNFRRSRSPTLTSWRPGGAVSCVPYVRNPSIHPAPV